MKGLCKYLFVLTTVLAVFCSNGFAQQQKRGKFQFQPILGTEDSRELGALVTYLASSSNEHGDASTDAAEAMIEAYPRIVNEYVGHLDDHQDVDYVIGKLEEWIPKFPSPEHSETSLLLLDIALGIKPKRADLAFTRFKIEVENEDEEDQSSRKTSQKVDGIKKSKFAGVYEIDIADFGPIDVEGISKRQSLVKGLLVQQIRGGRFAGSASQMNATIVGSGTEDSLEVKFNQKVGESMMDSNKSMLKFLKKRHKSLPNGIGVEIAFEEQYVPKDGPSAGIACTLMMESLLKGYDYNNNFAVTGAIDDEGMVGGVGGVSAKIRGAIARNCDVVAIPSENEAVIADMVVVGGVRSLLNIQVISIETFDDALKVAKRSALLDAEVRTAFEKYRKVAKLIQSSESYLANPKIQNELREVLQTLPNHLSAKYILLKALRRNPTNLSLIGSVEMIEREAFPIIEAIEAGDFDVKDKLGKDSFADTATALKRLRPQLDKRTSGWCDALIQFSNSLRTATTTVIRTRDSYNRIVGDINSSSKLILSERKKLFEREDVKKELFIDDDDDEE